MADLNVLRGIILGTLARRYQPRRINVYSSKDDLDNYYTLWLVPEWRHEEMPLYDGFLYVETENEKEFSALKNYVLFSILSSIGGNHPRIGIVVHDGKLLVRDFREGREDTVVKPVEEIDEVFVEKLKTLLVEPTEENVRRVFSEGKETTRARGLQETEDAAEVNALRGVILGSLVNRYRPERVRIRDWKHYFEKEYTLWVVPEWCYEKLGVYDGFLYVEAESEEEFSYFKRKYVTPVSGYCPRVGLIIYNGQFLVRDFRGGRNAFVVKPIRKIDEAFIRRLENLLAEPTEENVKRLLDRTEELRARIRMVR